MQETQKDKMFWQALNTLVKTSNIVIDRLRGTTHPRYPEFIYPLDYGYLQGTHSGDGDGIDVWLGSLPERVVTAVIFTVDLQKRDSEMKLLIGCTQEEMQTILAIHRRGQQSAILIESP